jgi:hypothetical protein
MSEREALAKHAEVKAMQERLGLSYQDAAHRLYMAAVGKAEVAQEGQVGLAELRQRIDKTIKHEIWPVVRAIDEGLPEGEELNTQGGSGRVVEG